MTRSRLPSIAAVLTAAALAGACASAPQAVGDGRTVAASPGARPLAALAGGARVMVLPTRYLDVDPQVRWWSGVADSTGALVELDAALRTALQERGVGSEWVWPDALRRSVARSAGMVTDPARWNATSLRNARAGETLGVTADLHSQLRALAALHDARYALYPVAYVVRPEFLSGGAQRGPTRAALRLALIDVRTATVDWVGTVTGPHVAGYSSVVPAGVASLVADLVAPAR